MGRQGSKPQKSNFYRTFTGLKGPKYVSTIYLPTSLVHLFFLIYFQVLTCAGAENAVWKCKTWKWRTSCRI